MTFNWSSHDISQAGQLKRQCLQSGSAKASDLSIALSAENETFEVRADIATAKAKLFQAETTGMPEIIRVYGDLLTELLRKENNLRRIGKHMLFFLKNSI